MYLLQDLTGSLVRTLNEAPINWVRMRASWDYSCLADDLF